MRGAKGELRGSSVVRKRACLFLVLSSFFFLSPAGGQFTDEEIAARPRWEQFLKEADIIGQEQMSFEEGVTEPWKLTLRQGDVVRVGLWKNPTGVRGGYLEGWKYEIAAYLMDKLFDIRMVPPTVERIFNGQPGSCQLWIDDTRLYRDMAREEWNLETFRTEHWQNLGYISQLFDNLIGNEDRHQGNVLVTPDFRAILIDHSRTFRTRMGFMEWLPYTENNVPPENLMRRLPRALVEKLSTLTERSVRETVGDLLTDEEIRAVMSRKGLLLELVHRIIARFGEEDVLY